ncbi:MAG: glutamate racemase [Oscillospiraceae bacterium]|nr:glutamate racemase [Oscillospiraceae bacterium]
MNNNAIGVFDSGLGGLTCLKELNKLIPNENVIYFGDTARLPYGTRSRETILEYAHQDISFVKSKNVKMIIAACGTVSSVLGSGKTSDGDVPFTGVLLPAAQAACGLTRNGKVGVIGTEATIKSGSYGKAIRGIRPDVSVIGAACPLFVPLVENGFTARDNKVAQLVTEQYLAPIKKEGVDTLILGCTHYPIIKDVISDFMGDSVTLVSSGEEAAKYAYKMLMSREMLSDREENGTNTYYTSDSIELFEENARAFLGSSLNGDVYKVGIDELISAANQYR